MSACRQLVRTIVVLAAGMLGAARGLPADDVRQSTVGFPARIEQLVLPGTELQAQPWEDNRRPIALRIIAVYPHGTAFRYDLEYYGLEPGRFDLTDYLQRQDGSPTDDLPPLLVDITSVLPPGQVQPNAVAPAPSPRLGGYRSLLIAAALLWVVGLAAILWWIRAERVRQRRTVARDGQVLSLAERLRPIVQDAIAGKTTDGQLAELERMLLVFWRRRLQLENVTAADAIRILRGHPEAGALLEQLEEWLHRPGTRANVDVAALLGPYQNLPADALEPS